MKKATTALVALMTAGLLLLAVPILVVAEGSASAACATQDTTAVDAKAVAAHVATMLANGDNRTVSVTGLDAPAEQVANAKVIEATGIAMGLPVRGRIVALAAALQESRLRNLAYGDRDSLGLFQQRPSQGWGTAEQILDPVRAATMFYAALENVPGWQSLTIGQAAQVVQNSGLPDAYANWGSLATALQKAVGPLVTSGGRARKPLPPPARTTSDVPNTLAGACTTLDLDGADPVLQPLGALPSRYVIPPDAPEQARTAIHWALHQLGTPYQWGGHCNDPRGPDPIGRCDCSSLMQQSYRAAGITLPRTTYEQVRSGRPVPVQSLEPGDLVFTEGAAAAPGHVGMYVGSGLIVNAPHTGAVVRVETLASWNRQILASRRVL